ncbi:hypothetical protein DPMN_023185 [Dreissena polymorpha]|uniref:Uncharacterized protein n=1 Tax=Dreissena polymorpha TaxID=45954 RepID=A0A9D4LLM5_DREPO|nr:hypothetical protein DPMN_023185 [Dreissena polymorpha]
MESTVFIQTMPHSTYVKLKIPLNPLPNQLIHQPQKKQAHRRLYLRRHHNKRIALSSVRNIHQNLRAYML